MDCQCADDIGCADFRQWFFPVKSACPPVASDPEEGRPVAQMDTETRRHQGPLRPGQSLIQRELGGQRARDGALSRLKARISSAKVGARPLCEIVARVAEMEHYARPSPFRPGSTQSSEREKGQRPRVDSDIGLVGVYLPF